VIGGDTPIACRTRAMNCQCEPPIAKPVSGLSAARLAATSSALTSTRTMRRSSILRAIPLSTVGKRGQKGRTLFYRGPDMSRSWNIDGKRVCDLIGPGEQTVLPPTVHPDAGQPMCGLPTRHWKTSGPTSYPG
jgi:hypothetical protein